MFPCWKYHPDGRKLKVDSPEHMETLKLGSDWGDKPFPEIAKPEVEPLACPNCERMNASFNKAWNELTTQHRELQLQHQNLSTLKDKIELENAVLRKELADAKPAAEPSTPAPTPAAAPEPAPAPDPKPKKSAK